jgi:hypothetical protein
LLKIKFPGENNEHSSPVNAGNFLTISATADFSRNNVIRRDFKNSVGFLSSNICYDAKQSLPSEIST